MSGWVPPCQAVESVIEGNLRILGLHEVRPSALSLTEETFPLPELVNLSL